MALPHVGRMDQEYLDGIPEIDLDWLSEWMNNHPNWEDSLLNQSGDSRDSTASEIEIFYGSLLTFIVNLQVSVDHINQNEVVRLVQVTPDVAVYSMDTLLGYLPQQLATVMADVRDLARVDAIIPDVVLSSPVEVPLRLTLYGRADNKNTCVAILQSRGYSLDSTDQPDPFVTGQSPRPFGSVQPLQQSNLLPNMEYLFSVDPMVHPDNAAGNHQAEPIDLTTQSDRNSLINLDIPQPSLLPATAQDLLETFNTNFAPSRPAPSVESHREQFTPDEMSSALDRLFETLDEDDKTSMAEAAEAISSPLYPHQKQALHWMIYRENGGSLPPFWKETESGKYCNTLLNHTAETRPDSIKGGILADDMGLGKTLQMISLILTNFADTRPLAVPVPGRTRTRKTPNKVVKTDTEGGSARRKEERPVDGFQKIAAFEEEIRRLDQTTLRSESSPLSNPSYPVSQPSSVSQSSSVLQALPHSNTECEFKPQKKLLHPKLRLKSDKSCIEDSPVKISSNTSNGGQAEVTKEVLQSPPLKRPLDPSPVTSSTKSLLENPRKTILIDLPGPKKKSKKGKSHSLSKYEQWKRRKLSCDNQPQTVEHINTFTNVSIGQTDVRRQCSDTSETQKTGEKSGIVRQYSEHLSNSGECTEHMDTVVTLSSDDESNSSITKPVTEEPSSVEEEDDDELPDIMETEPSIEETFDKDAFMSENHCDENGRTVWDGPRGTLIICPLSVLSNWQGQLEEHIHPNVHINIHQYYGSERCRDAEEFKQKDVVLTTYGTLLVEFKAFTAGGQSLLMTTEWLRVVLDEGHCIRNPSAKQTKAVLTLQAQRKWVLTGTPIQNKMLDLWPLINFLNVQPLTERYWWRSIMEKPLQRGKKIAFKRVRQLMGHIAMRRTKNQHVDGKPLVELPKREVYIERIKMSDEESKLYKTMEEDGRITIKKYVNRNKLLEKYILVLEIMLRLRQMCCHRCLLPDDRLPPDESDDEGDEDARQKREMLQKKLQVISESEEECSVCVDALKTPVILPCAHYFCHQCILNSIKHKESEAKGSASCPLCRAPLTEEDIIELPPEKCQEPQVYGDWHSSTKVDALMSSLIKLREEDATIKSLVVSQFTSFLSLIQKPLQEMGFRFVRLDGKMSSGQRLEMIRQFSETGPETPTVFLLSLRAGGVGLNLTAASRVFLMEPHWNPATEEQCFDRCHRLGQKRDVIITKFISEGTIEERMLDLQEKKRQLMNKSFKKKQTQEERNKQRTQEIRDLMMIN